MFAMFCGLVFVLKLGVSTHTRHSSALNNKQQLKRLDKTSTKTIDQVVRMQVFSKIQTAPLALRFAGCDIPQIFVQFWK